MVVQRRVHSARPVERAVMRLARARIRRACTRPGGSIGASFALERLVLLPDPG
jgi:hypothetical protein